jgi:hypothetical protein
MLASLLRPKARRQQIDQTPFSFSSPLAPSDSSPWYRAARRRGAQRARRAGDSEYEHAPELQEIDEDMDQDWVGEEDEEDHEDDGPLESTPLLPIFSASHLGRCLTRDVQSRIG